MIYEHIQVPDCVVVEDILVHVVACRGDIMAELGGHNIFLQLQKPSEVFILCLGEILLMDFCDI